MRGTLSPLIKVTAGVEGHTPTRSMAGWATVWAMIGGDGALIPVVDRDNQTMDCAAELAGIDWTVYLQRGRGFWNDTHKGGQPGNRQIKLGIGRTLQFHDAASPFAQEHRKVGWWTEGHLWDRDDSDSWRLYTDYQPTALDLERADAFWKVARYLDGSGRPLGFSVDGRMRTSACGRRIIWARVDEIALALGPSNPACTVEPQAPLAKAVDMVGEGLSRLPAGLIGAREAPAACGACSCGPNACGLRRLAKSNAADVAPMAPESAGGVVSIAPAVLTPEADAGGEPVARLRRVIAVLRNRYRLDEPGARRALQLFLAGRGSAALGDPMNKTEQEMADELESLAKGADGDPSTADALAALDTALAKCGGGAEQPMAKDEDEAGGAPPAEDMDKASPEKEEPTDDEPSNDEGSGDEDSPPGCEDPEEDMGKGLDEDGGLDALIKGLDAIYGLMAEVPAIKATVDELRADMGAIKAELGTLSKAQTAHSGRLEQLQKGVDGIAPALTKAVTTIDASVALAKATAGGLKRVLELTADVQDLVKSGVRPGVSRLPTDNPNAAALRNGLLASVSADGDQRVQALNKAISAGQLPMLAINHQNALRSGQPVPPDVEAAIQAFLPKAS